MPTRRQTLALGAVLIAAPTLAVAQTANRPNPMPEALRKPRGDITLTEFFDYNCPFCKKIMPKMQQLISADPGLRVVFREWPVFGEGSDFAARAALAALAQGKYWQMHSGLMQMRDRAAEPSVMRVVRKLGLDEAKLRADMQSDRVSSHIATSFELADHMSLAGTPTLIAGDDAVFGDQSLDDIQALIAKARKMLG